MINRVIQSQFKKTQCDSASQFLDDFGGYPPAPLNCIAPKTKFNILCLTAIGRVVYNFLLFYRLASSENSRINSKLFEYPALDQITGIVADLKKIKTEIKSAFEQFGVFYKLIFIIILIIISPALLLFIFYNLLRIAFKISSKARRLKNSLGAFLPVINDDLEIMVMRRLSGQERIAAVKSHEHIHLAQYVSKIKYQHEKIGRLYLNSPDIYLTDDAAKDQFMLYLLEADEVEARLHEVVLSYYRSGRELPVTLAGFYELLATESFLSFYIKKVASDGADDFGIGFEKKLYFIRDKVSAEDIVLALFSLKSRELQRRFLFEVLPVMYGNLISYYGDSCLSENFHGLTHRPNFYDDLYGSK